MNPTPFSPIQMLWVRGQLSRLEQLCVRSFLRQGHPVHLYTYESVAGIPDGVQVLDAAEIVRREFVPPYDTAPFGRGSLGAFSDYFRYHLLCQRGGWWSDMDVVALRPWNFAEPALTASTDEGEHGRIGNGCVMRFSAHHPLMEACRQEVASLDTRQANIADTGPLLLHRKMKELRLSSLTVSPSVFCPVPWNASWQLLRPLWRRFSLQELKQRLRRPHLSVRFTSETVAVHLWNETWRANGFNKQVTQPRTCLYERLQRRWNR